MSTTKKRKLEDDEQNDVEEPLLKQLKPSKHPKQYVVVCGDRHWSDDKLIKWYIGQLHQNHHIVVHGGCRGVDNIAGKEATRLGFEVEVEHADWTKHGRAAGPIRNSVMLARKPVAVLAFHNNLAASKGTKDTVNKAYKKRLHVCHITKHMFWEANVSNNTIQFMDHNHFNSLRNVRTNIVS